ncbi:MAG: type II toxin-antitoxin system RelE/ParE family toxin [Caldilineaceae bacterium]|nr:type II toxin-antitoxin system RelE/ParE family toxin [Caldilineaceae bacterium]
MDNAPHTIVETRPFIQEAKSRLTDEERSALIEMIATDPTCGVVLEGTGEIRKVRFGIQGRGKSGGVRVVYYFHSEALPVFLLAVFAKNEKANLSKAERNALAKLVVNLVESYRA